MASGDWHLAGVSVAGFGSTTRTGRVPFQNGDALQACWADDRLALFGDGSFAAWASGQRASSCPWEGSGDRMTLTDTSGSTPGAVSVRATGDDLQYAATSGTRRTRHSSKRRLSTLQISPRSASITKGQTARLTGAYGTGANLLALSMSLGREGDMPYATGAPEQPDHEADRRALARDGGGWSLGRPGIGGGDRVAGGACAVRSATRWARLRSLELPSPMDSSGRGLTVTHTGSEGRPLVSVVPEDAALFRVTGPEGTGWSANTLKLNQVLYSIARPASGGGKR